MLGWDVYLYRHREASPENLLARWTSRSLGIGWLDALVAQGAAQDLGGSGYPCLYCARAGVLLPLIAPETSLRGYPPPLLPISALLPANLGGLHWHLDRLADCPPDEELLVHAFDQS